MTQYLFYTENYVYGGGNKYMVDLMNGLMRDSVSIVLWCNKKGFSENDKNNLELPIICKFINVLNVKLSKNVNSIFINRFIYFISIVIEPFLGFLNMVFFVLQLLRERPDKVIVCNGGYPAARSCLSMIFAARLCKIPAVLSVVSMPAPRRNFISLYDKLLDLMVTRSVNFIIVNCLAIKNSLSMLRGFSPGKIHVIYNAIQNKPVFSLNIFEKESITIGCIARMDFNKGVIVLLEAFKRLSKAYPHTNLMLVGEGDASKQLLSKIQEYGLEKRVKLLGFHKGNILSMLYDMDIFVLPSFWEGLPYSIIEACSCGRAVIATDVGGVSEIIEDRSSGLLIKPNSEEALFNALELLVKDPIFAKKLGLQARKIYEEKFNLNAMRAAIGLILK